MKRILINIGIVFLFLSCSGQREFDERYYERSPSNWKEYLENLHFDEIQLKDEVFLIVNSSNCSPCENELLLWNDLQHTVENPVNLIVVEKYAAAYSSFLSRLDIELESAQDSTSYLSEHDLVPLVPVKVLFNEKSEVELMYPIGSGGKLDHFLSYLNKH
jgi:hypothetical protein